jgi:hypothetical protein
MDPSACGDHRTVEQVVVGLRMTSNALRAFMPRESAQPVDDSG